MHPPRIYQAHQDQHFLLNTGTILPAPRATYSHSCGTLSCVSYVNLPGLPIVETTVKQRRRQFGRKSRDAPYRGAVARTWRKQRRSSSEIETSASSKASQNNFVGDALFLASKCSYRTKRRAYWIRTFTFIYSIALQLTGSKTFAAMA